MEQGKYKTLLLKLFGASFGLVAMLLVATTVVQKLMPDKSTHVMAPVAPDDSYTVSFSYSPEFQITPKELKLVVDTQRWETELVMEAAQIAMEAVKLEHYGDLLDVHSDKLEALSDTIAEIAEQRAIPEAIKQNIIASLGRELEKAEKKLTSLEDRVVKFSYKMILPQSRNDMDARCNGDKDIIIRECDGACDKNNVRERTGAKGSIEAFYWI